MAGKRRTKGEWQQLIADFESGNESTTIFCRSHGISTSNFYKQRTMQAAGSTSAFVAARRAAPSACVLTVQVGEVVIRCDTHTPVAWVADLVAALRA
jgi:hypothetical protein